MIRIGLVEPNEGMRLKFQKVFTLHADFSTTVSVSNADELVRKKDIIQHPDVIIVSDRDRHDCTGSLARIKDHYPDSKLMVMCEDASPGCILACIKAGTAGIISTSSTMPELLNSIRVVSSQNTYIGPAIAGVLFHALRHEVKSEHVPMDTELKGKKEEIPRLLAEGKTYQEIADTLSMRIDNLRYHIKQIYKQLNINSKTELIAMYYKGQVGRHAQMETVMK